MEDKKEKNTKDVYKELKEKHSGLPEYDKLNHLFEISTCENTDFLLRQIIRKIMDKYENYSALIEELMQGDSKMSNYYQWKTLDEDKKMKLMELYKEIMLKIRSATELSLDTDEEKEAKFVEELLENWNSLRSELKNCIKELKEGWKTKIDMKERIEYMG